MPTWIDGAEAALNAVLGDYLERRGNRLATPMALFHDGRPLSLDCGAIAAAHPRLSPKVVVLVHGMAATEACWSFPEDAAKTYGTLLYDELGWSPFYVRYNTGRRIAHNGRALAELLEQLIDAFPGALGDITLIGHSLGGLVIRSACHHADQRGFRWIRRARRAFYLGSPHLGAPLEKGGRLLSAALASLDHPVVRLVHSVAELRSAGVKDLGDGALLDLVESESSAPLEAGPRGSQPVPLLPHMDHFLVAGTLAKREDHIISRLLGDSMVPVPSALDPGRRYGLPATNMAVIPGVHHVGLAHSSEVYERIRAWLGGGVTTAAAKEAAPSVAPEPAPPNRPLDRTDLLRWDAYRTLVQEGIDHGASAIQVVQEEMTHWPYMAIEGLSPLKAPTRVIRSLHLAAIGKTYDTIRQVNRIVAAVAREGFQLATR